MDPVSTTAAIANSVMMILGILSDSRKNALYREHQEAIQALNDAQNAKFPNYATSAVQLAEEKLFTFRMAFYQAVADQLKEGKK